MSIFWLVKKNWVERKKIHGKIHLLGHFLFLLSAGGWERFRTVCAPYPSLPCTSSRIPKYAVHSTAVKTQNWANITILTPGEWQPKICAVKSGWGLSAGKCLLFSGGFFSWKDAIAKLSLRSAVLSFVQLTSFKINHTLLLVGNFCFTMHKIEKGGK